jgi:hypothetical protein
MVDTGQICLASPTTPGFLISRIGVWVRIGALHENEITESPVWPVLLVWWVDWNFWVLECDFEIPWVPSRKQVLLGFLLPQQLGLGVQKSIKSQASRIFQVPQAMKPENTMPLNPLKPFHACQMCVEHERQPYVSPSPSLLPKPGGCFCSRSCWCMRTIWTTLCLGRDLLVVNLPTWFSEWDFQ